MISYIRSNYSILKYLTIWSVYTIAYTSAIYFVVPLSLRIILTDSAIHTILLFFASFAIWRIISRHTRPAKIKKVIPIFIFACIAVWIGVGYLADILILGNEYARALAPTIPIRVITGALLLVIVVAYSISVNERKKEREEERIAELLLFGRSKSDEEIHSSDNQEEEYPRSSADAGQTGAEEAENLPETTEIERISVRTGGKIIIIPLSEIIYIRSYGDYVYIIAEKGKFIKEQTMKYFESSLPHTHFIRIHRSYIVNVSKISRIELSEKQNQQIILTNGDKLKISATGYKVLRKSLNI